LLGSWLSREISGFTPSLEVAMIENVDIAKKISDLMLEYGARLDQSVALVSDRCNAEELRAYRRAVGKILGEMLLEVMNPIYARHPILKPKDLYMPPTKE
jgi:hypothetical protein